MKALVLTQYNQFEFQDWPVPEVGPDDVLIRVAACGICGSDVHGMDGSTGRRRPPIIMGHEAAGTVVQVGSNARRWSEGDRVTFDSTIYCGNCATCRQGRINLCDRRQVMGVSCDEYRRHGAMAEFIALPQRILVRLPAGVSFQQAAMVEPISVALHAVRRNPVSRQDCAVVIGAGMIGLLVIQCLRAEGCGRVIAVDVDQCRLDLAAELGADEIIRSDVLDGPAEVIRLTQGRGADLALEVVGVAATVQMAIASVCKGGRLTLIGNLAPRVDAPLQAIVTRELTLAGSCASSGEYPACLEMLASGAIRVEPLISATAPLHQGAEWFQRLHGRQPGLMKVLLEP